jgi:hypothetical protein
MGSQPSGLRRKVLENDRRSGTSSSPLIGGLLGALMMGCAATSVRHVEVVYDVAPGSATVDCGGKSRSVCVRVDKVAEDGDWDHFVRGAADVSVWAMNRNLFCSTESSQFTAKAFSPPSPFTGQPASLFTVSPKFIEDLPAIPPKEESPIDKGLRELVAIVAHITAELNWDEDQVAHVWLYCVDHLSPADRVDHQKTIADGLRTEFVAQNQAWNDSFKQFAGLVTKVSALIEQMPDGKAPDEKASSKEKKKAAADAEKKKAAVDALTKVKADRADLDKAIAKVRADVAPVLASLTQMEAEQQRTTPSSDRPYPTATLLDQQSFDPNQTVTVEIQQQILPTGTASGDGKQRSLGKTTFNTLSPIRLDVGIGPAWIMENAESWSVTAAPGATVGTVTRSEQLNMDGIVTFSWYYRTRYLDGKLIDWDGCWPSQWLPRPTLGLSIRSPFSSIYGGVQIDPVRFVDLSFGVYVHSRSEPVGVTEGEVVPTGTIGTRNQVAASPFLSVSSSINLFVGWFSNLFK